MPNLSNKKAMNLTEDTQLNNIISRIYDDLNEVIEVVNKKQNKKNIENIVPDWTEISKFKNDWENYGDTATTTAFYKYKQRVYLKGHVKTGAVGSNSVIFTLPSDCRPEATNIFTTIVSGGHLGRIHVRKDGDVVAFATGTTDAKADAISDAKAAKLLTLDGINFKIRE